ncbi:glycerophosphodiester phosphodiesterase family protein [Spirosoma validum]|uniref:Glycerophosphodiester phosphodiesterase family protein n=1 Tax=Spirosoma validum TaxID=2771355 RepID=A0A927GCP0_9BACT|nr:glycerophosphodiester phosphodiesterase family protein [Spirosoma validum]MBD2752725.1 glycerophosphodiester phosphodiesterase family protein [Spirosoma validum]
MKIPFLVLLITLVASNVAAQQINRFQNTQSIDDFFQYKPNRKRPLILAHRGGPGPADTENSIVTFAKTAKMLPDAIIEMDVRMTRDSSFVLLHDATLDRESNAKGPVAEWTLSDLREIKLKTLVGELTDQQIPTFSEILAWNKNRFMLALDIKPGTDPLSVMKEVQKQQAEYSVFVICYSFLEAQRVRNRYPTLWLAVGINGIEDIARLEKDSLLIGRRLIALTPQKVQPASFYERLHKLGIPCSVGTYGAGQLDEKPVTEATQEYRALFRQGGDIITTDRPVEVSKLF